MPEEEHTQSFHESGQLDEEKETERTPEIEKEIGIDEFQPKGTLTIVLLYFVIVVLMWIFMYFIEFAGNDPSIIN